MKSLKCLFFIKKKIQSDFYFVFIIFFKLIYLLKDLTTIEGIIDRVVSNLETDIDLRKVGEIL